MSSDPRPHDVAPGADGQPADGQPPAPLGLSVVVAHLDVSDAEDVLRSLAGRLLDAGAVTLDFPEALRAREQRYPTGLPTPIPTAIPHADPEHVLVPGLAIATLAHPIAFGEMGGTGSTVDARLVAMPLLTDARAHLAALQSLMGLLRDEAAVQDLLDAADEDELRQRTMTHLSGGTVAPKDIDDDSRGHEA
ncbi:MAG: PTS sugar transporter subunit IIA [Brachybacterium tyrofermentans]